MDIKMDNQSCVAYPFLGNGIFPPSPPGNRDRTTYVQGRVGLPLFYDPKRAPKGPENPYYKKSANVSVDWSFHSESKWASNHGAIYLNLWAATQKFRRIHELVVGQIALK